MNLHTQLLPHIQLYALLPLCAQIPSGSCQGGNWMSSETDCVIFSSTLNLTLLDNQTIEIYAVPSGPGD